MGKVDQVATLLRSVPNPLFADAVFSAQPMPRRWSDCLLVEAYRRGEARGGSIDWGDLDEAYQAALRATGSSSDGSNPSPACERLVVVMEGGIVQAVIANQPDTAPDIAVVDYDTDGYEPNELRPITQSDGSQSLALVIEHFVEPAGINLDEVFQESE